MDNNIKEEVAFTLEKNIDGSVDKVIPATRLSFDLEAEQKALEEATLGRDNTITTIETLKKTCEDEISILNQNLANYEKTILTTTAGIENYNNITK